VTTCVPAVVDICRQCRTHVSWPVTGVAETDIAQAYLDGSSVPIALAIAPDLQTVIGYFAGPDFATPGSATVLQGVTVVVIEIVTATETNRFPGGLLTVVA